jgi:hypothetical protein
MNVRGAFDWVALGFAACVVSFQVVGELKDVSWIIAIIDYCHTAHRMASG